MPRHDFLTDLTEFLSDKKVSKIWIVGGAFNFRNNLFQTTRRADFNTLWTTLKEV
jgi:inosine-uridine nucleoside N-ribohydrolase